MERETIVYSVVVRDENRNLYKDSKGHNIVNFKKETPRTPVGNIKLYCESLNRQYKAIAKVGSTVDVEVLILNEISGTYMCMHSLYDYKDKTEFINH